MVFVSEILVIIPSLEFTVAIEKFSLPTIFIFPKVFLVIIVIFLVHIYFEII